MNMQRGLALLLLAIGCAIWIWSVLPLEPQLHRIAVKQPQAEEAGLPDDMILSDWRTARLGQAVEIRLFLPGREGTGLPLIAQAEARLALPGMDIEPGSRLVQTVTPGKPVTFIWRIQPFQVGLMEGTVWLYWKAGEGEKAESLAVLARPLQVSVVGFFGLPVWVGQVIGLALAGLGVGLWFRRMKTAGAGKKLNRAR